MPFYPHDLKAGVDVFSHDSHKLGTLHSVVLKRSDLSLTHVVVDIGFLRSGRRLWQGGLGLDYDRLVPIAQVHAASDEGVELRLTAEEFKDAPEYTVDHFEQPFDLTPGEFDIPDVVNRAAALGAIAAGGSNIWLVERLNKPLEGVDIAAGTDVWRREPHEKLGDVRRLLLDPDTGRLRALVIRRGALRHRDIVLPARYIAELFDDLVRVDIDDEALAQLREYKEAD